MMVAFYNGVSGIKTQSVGIDVSSNNVSNVNTVGFKGSKAEFKDVFYQNVNTAEYAPDYSQLGLASSVAATALDVSTGSFENTDSMLDMAIQGDGWFRVADGRGDVYYTRAGAFKKNVNGDIVNDAGYYLMGTVAEMTETQYTNAALQKLGTTQFENALSVNASSDLPFSETTTNINLPDNLYMPVNPSTNVSFKGKVSSDVEYEYKKTELDLSNADIQISGQDLLSDEEKLLSLSANVKDTPSVTTYNPGDDVAITITDGSGQSLQTTTKIQDDGSFSISNYDVSALDVNTISISAASVLIQEKPATAKFVTDLYSPNGYNNNLSINLTKSSTDDDGSTWDAIATVTDKDGNVLSTTQGQMRFNQNGAFVSSTLQNVDNEGVNVALNFGSGYNPDVPNSGYDGISLHSGPTALSEITKDGYADGLLQNYTINEDGTIIALFDNAQQAAVAKVPVFHFQNDQGLFSLGGSGTIFAQSVNSGEAFMYAKEDGAMFNGSKVRNYLLEMSNVDFGDELTNIIVMQKAYEASARSITTSDEMIQNAINMKGR